MKPLDVKYAFGSTPEHTRACIRRALQTEVRRKTPIKKRVTVTLILAAVLILSCVGLAATQDLGILNIFSIPGLDDSTAIVNEPVRHALHPVCKSHQANTARCTIDAVLYDSSAQTLSLQWIMEPLLGLAEGEKLYVICEEVRIGDDWLRLTTLQNLGEYFLDFPTVCAISGTIPENAGTQLSLTFSILRTQAEIVDYQYDETLTSEENRARQQALLDSGQLPVAMDGVIEVPVPDDVDIYETRYTDQLLSTGLMTLADHFTLTLDVADFADPLPRRTLAKPVTMDFGSGPMIVTQCISTPTRTTITLDAPHAPPEAPLCTVLLQHDKIILWGGDIWSAESDSIATLDIPDTQLFPDAVILVPGISFSEDGRILFDPETAVYLPLTDQP